MLLLEIANGSSCAHEGAFEIEKSPNKKTCCSLFLSIVNILNECLNVKPIHKLVPFKINGDMNKRLRIHTLQTEDNHGDKAF